MPPGTPAFTATGMSEYPTSGGTGGSGEIAAVSVLPGDFQNGTYNFPGGLEINGVPVVVSGGTLSPDEIGPGTFQPGTYDFPSVGGLTVAGRPVFTAITADDVDPGTFGGLYNFTQAPTVNGQAMYYRSQGRAAGVLGTDIALETVTGAAGIGLGNIAGASIYGYNIHPASLTYDLLSGVAQAQVLAFTVQDTPFSFLRRVSQTGSVLDANGKETDGFTVAGGATRVADPQAYNAWAITNTGVAVNAISTGGPGVALQPGQYVVNVFFRVSTTTAANVLSVQATGTNVASNPVITVKGTDLATSYVGIAVPFTVTGTGGSVSIKVINLIASGTAQWWMSHAHADPSTGKATQMTSQYFFANAAITSAQIQSITATQITAGTISSDNIFMGPGGHLYMGPQAGPVSGFQARVELNSAGLFAYDGTKQTVAINASGSASFKGDITGATGTFSGNLSGANISGATGTFTGTLSATNGTIGGWTIGPTSLSGSGIISGGQINGATLNTVTLNSSMLVVTAGSVTLQVGSVDGATSAIEWIETGNFQNASIDAGNSSGSLDLVSADLGVGPAALSLMPDTDMTYTDPNDTVWVSATFLSAQTVIEGSNLTADDGGNCTGNGDYTNGLTFGGKTYDFGMSSHTGEAISSNRNSADAANAATNYLGLDFYTNRLIRLQLWNNGELYHSLTDIHIYKGNGSGIGRGGSNVSFVMNISNEIRVQNFAMSAYNPIRASSFPIGSSLSTTKENVELYTGALEAIRRAPVHTWHYKPEHSSENRDVVGRHVFPMREEMPEETWYDEDGVELRDTIGVLWQGLRELADEVQELREMAHA